MAPPAARSSPSHRTRRTLVSVALILLVYIAGRAVLGHLLDPQGSVAGLQSRLGAALGSTVEVGGVGVGLFPPSLRIREVAARDHVSASEAPLRAGSVVLRVAVLPLLRGKVRFTEWLARDLSVDLGGGSAQIADLKLRLSRVSVRSHSGPRGGDGTMDLTATAEGEMILQSPPFRIHGPLEWGLRLRFDPGRDQLLIRTGKLRVGKVALEVMGQIGGLRAPVPTVVLEAWKSHFLLQDLLDLLQAGAEGERRSWTGTGSASLTLRVAGEAGRGRTPLTSGTLEFSGHMLARDGVLLGERFSADLTLAPRLVWEGAARGTFVGGPFEVDGSLSLGGGGATVDAFLRAAPRLEGLALLGALPEGMRAAGTLGGVVRLRGPLADPSRLEVSGELHPLGVTLTFPSWPGDLTVGEGFLRVQAGRLLVDSLPVVVGGEASTASGEIPDLLGALAARRVPRFQGAVLASQH